MARRTKRSDGRYVVNIRVEQPDGTRKRAYFYGRTQAEARAKAEAAQARVAAGGPVRDDNQPLSAWLCYWRDTVLRASDRAPSTKQMYAGLMARHVAPVIGHVTLAQLRPTDITRVLLSMEQAGKSASTRSPLPQDLFGPPTPGQAAARTAGHTLSLGLPPPRRRMRSWWTVLAAISQPGGDRLARRGRR